MLRLERQRGSSFLPLLLLLLLLLLPAGDGKPHAAPEQESGASRERGHPLEAVKAGILTSLGMDREPRVARRASEEELREMYRLYWDKLTELRSNSSQAARGASAVLAPASVELLKVLQRGGGNQPGHLTLWYRAVFHKTPHIQAQLMLARAELTIARRLFDGAMARRKVKVRVNGRRVASAPARDPQGQAAAASRGRAEWTSVDLRPEVEAWIRRGGADSLVVDVGVSASVGRRPPLVETPDILLEVEGAGPGRRARRPRSAKEDACSEPGLCCRRSVTVSFKDIGWEDWVVAPAQYTMHYCDGGCPHNYKPAGMHTQVKSHMHRVSKGALPGPCCVPAAYEPMVLMHYDSGGKLTLTPFDDMIVSKCHCA